MIKPAIQSTDPYYNQNTKSGLDTSLPFRLKTHSRGNQGEKAIDLAGKVSYAFYWLSWVPYYGTELMSLLGKKISTHLFQIFLPSLATFLILPTTVFSLGCCGVLGIAELSNLQRTILFYQRLDKKKHPIDQITWIKNHYFTVEERDKNGKISEKMLKHRFSALKSRVDPKMAIEIQNQIQSISKGFKSWNPFARYRAEKHAEIAAESIIHHTKSKIVVHVLGLLTTAISVASLVLFVLGLFSGISCVALIVLFTVIAVTRFIIQKGVLQRDGKILHQRLVSFPKSPLQYFQRQSSQA